MVEKYALVLLIIGLAIGAGAAYGLLPRQTEIVEKEVQVEVHPLEGKVIQIGATCAEASGLETQQPMLQIAQKDINDYCKKLGYDTTFEFLLEDCEASSSVALEKTQAFKLMGINLINGHRWTPLCQSCLKWANENDVLLLSASSTATVLHLPDDNLFRTVCPDNIQAPAIAKMLWEYGIDACVFMYTAHAWGDGMFKLMAPAYEEYGGVILGSIRYAPECTEFSSYLAEADALLAEAIDKYGKDHVGFQLTALTESVTIVTQAADYPTLMSVPWFGSDGTARRQQIVDDAIEYASQVKLYSTLMAPGYSPKFYEVEDKYREATGLALDFYEAADYDNYWLLSLSVLEAGKTETAVIKDVLPDVASRYFGASGWCMLDETGDRAAGNYEIWGFGYKDGVGDHILLGIYDLAANKITWDPSVQTTR